MPTGVLLIKKKKEKVNKKKIKEAVKILKPKITKWKKIEKETIKKLHKYYMEFNTTEFHILLKEIDISLRTWYNRMDEYDLDVKFPLKSVAKFATKKVLKIVPDGKGSTKTIEEEKKIDIPTTLVDQYAIVYNRIHKILYVQPSDIKQFSEDHKEDFKQLLLQVKDHIEELYKELK
jgi:hypothetical protein